MDWEPEWNKRLRSWAGSTPNAEKIVKTWMSIGIAVLAMLLVLSLMRH